MQIFGHIQFLFLYKKDDEKWITIFRDMKMQEKYFWEIYNDVKDNFSD